MFESVYVTAVSVILSQALPHFLQSMWKANIATIKNNIKGGSHKYLGNCKSVINTSLHSTSSSILMPFCYRFVLQSVHM